MKIEIPIETVMTSYGNGHDVNFTIFDFRRNKLFYISLSILLNFKHIAWWENSDGEEKKEYIRNQLDNYVQRVLGIPRIDLVVINLSEEWKDKIERANKIKKMTILDSLGFTKFLSTTKICADSLFEYQPDNHHMRHAWCGYGQSKFDKCIALTQDGIGDNECFVLSSFKQNEANFLQSHDLFNGLTYMQFAEIALTLWNSDKEPHMLKNFRTFLKSKKAREKHEWSTRFQPDALDCAGKGMGMVAFEKPDKETFQKIYDLYTKEAVIEYWNPRFGMLVKAIDDIKPGIYYADQETQRSFAVHIMYACQAALENTTLKIIEENKQLIQDHDNNLVLSGGVALNVLLNQKIKELYPHFNIYVPPNPDDSGLSMGDMFHFLMKNDIEYERNLIYSGMQIVMDVDVNEVLERSRKTTVQEISDLLSDGKIVALFRGRSEVGARALGNRSILADPKFADTKDKINKKVKFREAYRPFAPVCRKEDAPIYFDSPDYENMECMSFCPKVREEYKGVFPSIVHVDGTARLQTVTKEVSPLFYELLSVHPTDILLNTSFNVGGKPICNKMSTALEILDTTGLDHLVWEHRRQLYII